MASRLISNIHTTRASLAKQFVRPMATSANQSTRTTVLPNGFTVATESNPSAGAATVGVWVDAGSRLETAQTHGVANFLERVALKGKTSALEKLGGITKAGTTREQTFFATKVLGSNASASVEILGDLVQGSVSESSVEQARAGVLKQQQEASSQPDQIVFDHLHATAFQGEALGRPVEGYAETISSLTAKDLTEFQKKYYAANRLVLVGAGDVDHDALVKEAEKAFGSLEPNSSLGKADQPSFTGSEIRIRDDLASHARIALAVESAGYLTPEYYNFLVMQAIIGSYDKTLLGSGNLTSRLSAVVDQNRLADSFISFNKAYKDTGLFGIYAITQNRDQIDDFVHFLQKEWVRLSTSVTASEVEIAKQQVKAGLLLAQQDSTCSLAQSIGSQVLASGKHLSAAELADKISKVSVKDITATASKYLWDNEVAVVGTGPVECLTDYNRVRGNMAYNRF
ncbi:putative MAS1-mitochondrial processing peptidase beta chain precursor [Syncephalastrum racemosum]|uniref:mitochondrial processing peptidase n=1 Tax=Syncephalastrum racemosum TaxID=13706 RepID=A0A1X2H1R0_SYNRA|nr:putative MAS1-mitochondrial processing peptidase beta chain precursor [Syncephalastrum racemosum]